MNPIFNEYLTFLRDTSGKSLSELKEGYFWLDRQIIKGFDKQGFLHKFYRISISDDLKLTIHQYFLLKLPMSLFLGDLLSSLHPGINTIPFNLFPHIGQ